MLHLSPSSETLTSDTHPFFLVNTGIIKKEMGRYE
jgi:hypothetical protein